MRSLRILWVALALTILAAAPLAAGCSTGEWTGDGPAGTSNGSATQASGGSQTEESATAEGAGKPTQGPARFDPSFEHGNVAVDGGTIHYVRGGEGPPLVLVHGWPETWYAWREVMPELARNHTVIAVDLPGLGDSSVFEDGYDTVTAAARVHEAVNELGYDQVEIMAHDIGTWVAYDYARDYPEEVERLAVLEVTLLGFDVTPEGERALQPSFGWWFYFNQIPASYPEQIIDDDEVGTWLDYFYDGNSRDPADIAPESRAEYARAYANPESRSAGYDYYRAIPQDIEDNQANAEPTLEIPVLALGAEYLYGEAVEESYGNVAEDVRGVVVPDSGHFVAEENPQFLVECANLFFGDSAPQEDLPPELDGCGP